MFTKRFALTLLVIFIVLVVSTACDSSTSAPLPITQPMPKTIQSLPVVTSPQSSTSPADDNWLIECLNGEQVATTGQSSSAASQPNAPNPAKTSGSDEDWLIRCLNGE